MSFGEVSDYQGAEGMTDVIVEGFDVYIKVYNDTGAAVTNGDVFFLGFAVDADSLDPSTYFTLDALATSAIYRQIVVVNNRILGKATIGDTEWGYVQVRGYCPDVSITAASVAKSRYLQGKNATATLEDDGTTITTDSCAVAVGAVFSTTHVPALLFGYRTIIG